MLEQKLCLIDVPLICTCFAISSLCFGLIMVYNRLRLALYNNNHSIGDNIHVDF